jgi:hypothetical protein
MRGHALGRSLAGVACFVLVTTAAPAQQATVSTPYHSMSEGFFENFGTNWGLNGRNWFFSFGGSPSQAAPPFGGFDPGAGANLGFGFRTGGMGGFFSGNFSQGFRQSCVSQTPSLTLTNGYPGYVADASVSPFVISYVPVVGSFPRVGPPGPVPPAMMPSPGASGVGHDAVLKALQGVQARRAGTERMRSATRAQAEAARMNRPAQPNVQPRVVRDLQLSGTGSRPTGAPADEPSRKLAAARASSAGRPAPSVAEARRLRAAEQAAKNEEALKYIELGRNAEAKGKPNVARVYYQNAARRASGPLREQVLSRIQALEPPPQSR